MASTLPYVKVVLKPEEVPGAQLLYADIQQNSVFTLKRFLSCRKLRTTGNKSDLVQRVVEAIEKKVPIDPGVDGGSWLTVKEVNKRRDIIRTHSKPPCFPICWKPFPSTENIPSTFNYGHIYSYMTSLILDTEESDKENDEPSDEPAGSCTNKPFIRARQYVRSGYVYDVEDALSQGFYSVKAKIKASYQSHHYSVMIMLNCNGDVVDGSCHCKASATARCSHVVALLYVLEDHVRETQRACTSAHCKWNQGKKEKDPGVITKKYSDDACDPMHRVLFQPTTQLATENDIKTFAQEMQGSGNTCWGLLLKPRYEDYSLDDTEEAVLRQKVATLRQNLTFNSTGPKCITRGQSNDVKWSQYRKLLITASTIKEFHFNKTKESLFNIVDRSLYGKPYKCHNFEYGKQNEDKARAAYKQINPSFTVEETGLWINSFYGGIGASPDGLVKDPSEVTLGLLEIKCPVLLANAAHIATGIKTLSGLQQTRFYCSIVKNQVELKTSHKYYAQVQTQMGITGRQWCDFVIWCPSDIKIQRIHFNHKFFQELATTASRFHSAILAPEYFEHKLPRKLSPIILK